MPVNLDDGISLFLYTDEDDYIIEIFDDGEFDTAVGGPDFADVIRHALHEISPLLAASVWPEDYLEWHEKHRFLEKEEEDE